MQRNNDEFKKKLEEELSSHMRMKDQLKSRIRALQSIYDDANDKLELSQSLSQQSQDSCHELQEEVNSLERNLREVEKKNAAKISQLEGEAKEKEVSPSPMHVDMTVLTGTSCNVKSLAAAVLLCALKQL
ncbi:unnamed protein product [Symbiodinium pilosum]|uniref:Uncharacterized protein n=1 Tax=Symbiodinium pilosum TaxID=2952 RepID=A0A812Y6V0_SYMPI|nr:unnamed protein product [Symbiodinium pilosum]